MHISVSHLLAAWSLSITQITSNGWSYIQATITLLGQAGLFQLPTLVKINYLMYPIAQAGGYMQ